MKFKKLSKDQIIISIDRLTRFKPTGEKYYRVFEDILTTALIEPQYKKSDIKKLEPSLLRDMAVEIFNSSLNSCKNDDFSVNKKLYEYENSLFKNSDDVKILLDNKLDFVSAVMMVSDDTKVLNLKWLKHLVSGESLCESREIDKLQFPIEKVVIAEGITEEILLPEFARLCGFDFDENGVKIIAAGGKNQVVKLYYKLCDELKCPIFVLLDKDAQTNEYSINSKLRQCDKVYLLDSGEFEDLLPSDLIIRTINNEFKNFITVNSSDLNTGESTVKTLEEIYKEKGLHEFKKAEFAQRIKQQLFSLSDVSSELCKIIEEIKTFQ